MLTNNYEQNQINRSLNDESKTSAINFRWCCSNGGKKVMNVMLYCGILDIFSKFNFTPKKFFWRCINIKYFLFNSKLLWEKEEKNVLYECKKLKWKSNVKVGAWVSWWLSSLTSEPNTIVMGSHPNTYLKSYVFWHLPRHWIWVSPVSFLDLSELGSPLKSSSHDITEKFLIVTLNTKNPPLQTKLTSNSSYHVSGLQW